MNSSAIHVNMVEREGSFLKPRVRYAPVWRTVLLTFITMGVYFPYWLISRRKEVNKLAGKTVIHKNIPIVIFIGYLFSALMFTIGPFFLNEIALMLYEYIDIGITFVGMTFILFYSFRIRSVLNEDGTINGILTFLFTIWYLQYHINQRY